MMIAEREQHHEKAIERERQGKREELDRWKQNPLQNQLVEALLKADLESVKMLEAQGRLIIVSESRRVISVSGGGVWLQLGNGEIRGIEAQRRSRKAVGASGCKQSIRKPESLDANRSFPERDLWRTGELVCEIQRCQLVCSL